MKIVVLENIKDIINCNGWSGIMVNLVGKEYDVYTETRVQFYDKYGNHIDKKAVTIIRYDGKIDNYWVIPEGYYEIVDDEEEWDDISDGLFDSYNPKYINFFEDVNIDPFEEENWEESEFTKEDIISLENIKNMINDDNNYHIKKVGIGKFDGKEVYCNYLYNHKNDMWDQDYLVICILYNEKYSHKDGYEYDFTSISNENNNMKNGITVNGIIVDLYDNFLSIIENGMKEKESIEYNDMINRYKKLDIILRNKNNLSWEEKMKSKLISHELYKSIFGISKTHFYDDYMDMKRMGEHEWNDYNKRKSKIALDIFKEIKDDELFDSYDSKYIKFFENNSDDRFVINNDKFELYHNGNLVALSYFYIEEPDDLFDKKYVSIYKLETVEEFRGNGFMKKLLNHIFDYVKKLKINSILLNVYKSNTSAVNLYFKMGFEIYKDFNNDPGEDPYFTLIKNLNKKYESFEPEEYWEEESGDPIYIFRYGHSVYLIEKIVDNVIYLYNGFRWGKQIKRVKEIKEYYEENSMPTIEKVLSNKYIISVYDISKGWLPKYYKDLPEEIRNRITFDLSDIKPKNESFEPEEEWEEDEHYEDRHILTKDTLFKDFPFEEGDRVHIKCNYGFGNNHEFKEATGTLKTISKRRECIDYLGICFDDYINGHGLTGNEKCKFGNGWYFNSYYLPITITKI